MLNIAKYDICIIPCIHISCLTYYIIFYVCSEGSGPVHLSDVHCDLNNDLLIQCPRGSSVLCGHALDVVIQCCK